MDYEVYYASDEILSFAVIKTETLATAYALRLVRATKYNSVWILFIVGFSLLTIEWLVQLLMDMGVEIVPRWWFAYLGVTVSICLSIGVMYAHKLFKYIDRLNHQRTLLNKRILTAVLRTEEKARSRFSKELHDGLGPLLSSAKMSLTALSRDERSAEQREIIDNTTYVIEEAIRSLREISNNLSPHVLNDFGLARGVRNFIDKSAAMHDVKIRFTTNLRTERYDTDVEAVSYTHLPDVAAQGDPCAAHHQGRVNQRPHLRHVPGADDEQEVGRKTVGQRRNRAHPGVDARHEQHAPHGRHGEEDESGGGVDRLSLIHI